MQVEDANEGTNSNEDLSNKPDTMLSENELELKYKATVNRKRKRGNSEEQDQFANDQFKELDDVHNKRRKLDTSTSN